MIALGRGLRPAPPRSLARRACAGSRSRRRTRPGRSSRASSVRSSPPRARMGLRIHGHLSEMRRRRRLSASPPTASDRCTGWPTTTGSAPTSGSPISFTSMTRRSGCWPRPAPAWRIARNRTAGSAPASRRRRRWPRSAAPSRSRSTAQPRTKSADMVSEMHSAWHTHRAGEGRGRGHRRGGRALGERRRRARARLRRHRRARAGQARRHRDLRSLASALFRAARSAVAVRSPRAAPPTFAICWSAAASWSRTATIPGARSQAASP